MLRVLCIIKTNTKIHCNKILLEWGWRCPPHPQAMLRDFMIYINVLPNLSELWMLPPTPELFSTDLTGCSRSIKHVGNHRTVKRPRLPRWPTSLTDSFFRPTSPYTGHNAELPKTMLIRSLYSFRVSFSPDRVQTDYRYQPVFVGGAFCVTHFIYE